MWLFYSRGSIISPLSGPIGFSNKRRKKIWPLGWVGLRPHFHGRAEDIERELIALSPRHDWVEPSSSFLSHSVTWWFFSWQWKLLRRGTWFLHLLRFPPPRHISRTTASLLLLPLVLTFSLHHHSFSIWNHCAFSSYSSLQFLILFRQRHNSVHNVSVCVFLPTRVLVLSFVWCSFSLQWWCFMSKQQHLL